MNELSEEEKSRNPQTWKSLLNKKMIHAFVSGLLLGIAFIVTIISVAMFTRGA